MIKKLLRTIELENGELFAIVGSNRYLLATCQPNIEIYEHLASVAILGQQHKGVKKRHIVIALCPAPDFTREVNDEFLQRVSGFELKGDVWRQDGVFEMLVLNRLTLTEIEPNGNWRFEVNTPDKIAEKLLSI